MVNSSYIVYTYHMHAVLLDKDTLGDIDLSPILKILPELKIYNTTSPNQIADRCRDASIILTNKCILNKETLSQLKKIEYIQILATGMNNIDLEYANKRKIVVKNVENYSTESVAIYILSSILNLLTSIPSYITDVNKGKWEQQPTFTFLTHPIDDINGKTLGIIGYGNIGKKIAEIVKPLGMNVLLAKGTKSSYPEQRLPLDIILKKSDVVLLTCPLSKGTYHMIAMKELKMMQKSAYLINAARGPLINESDLALALKKNIIAGAALDVLSEEPPSSENPLRKCNHKKLYITPHIAWASKQSKKKLIDVVLGHCQEYIKKINR